MDNRQLSAYLTANLPISNQSRQPSIQNAESPSDLDGERAKKAFKHAKEGAIAATPLITGMGLAMIFHPGRDRYGISEVIRLLGVPVAIGGLVVDTVKLPFAASYSVGSLFWGLVLKIKSFWTRPNAEQQQTKEIMESFIHRFANTMQLLVALDLETPESLTQKINQYQSGDSQALGLLCALTTLNTAYASRALIGPSILLANGKVLHRSNCPQKGLEIFDSVVEIRDSLRALNFHRLTNSEATPLILQWLPSLKMVLEGHLSEIEVRDKLNDAQTAEIVIRMSQLLMKIGDIAKNQKPVVSRHLNQISHNSVQTIIRTVPRMIVSAPVSENNSQDSSVFLDPISKQPITNAVIGSDGLLYNQSVASRLLSEGRISRFVQFYSAGGPDKPIFNNEEFRIDPITCNEITHPVVANDGRIYDLQTALMLMNQRFIGVGGQVITDYIECPQMLSWSHQ